MSNPLFPHEFLLYNEPRIREPVDIPDVPGGSGSTVATSATSSTVTTGCRCYNFMGRVYCKRDTVLEETSYGANVENPDPAGVVFSNNTIVNTDASDIDHTVTLYEETSRGVTIRTDGSDRSDLEAYSVTNNGKRVRVTTRETKTKRGATVRPAAKRTTVRDTSRGAVVDNR